MDSSEELLAEVDEPPDEVQFRLFNKLQSNLHSRYSYSPAAPQCTRRESLLTRQLHSETEHTDDEQVSGPPRALSTQSTWSQSTASTAELTSDDGRSVASPAISPPLSPTKTHHALPALEKSFQQRLKIVGHDDVPQPQKETGSEKAVEAGLGRKRCISFACKGKQDKKSLPTPPPAQVKQEPVSPPKRKCMLKFVCPTRAGSDSKPLEKAQPKRPISPPPPVRRPSASARAESGRTHRGSDSTVTHASPKSARKSPAVTTTAPTPTTDQPGLGKKYSNDSDESDSGNEAVRFHEFGTRDDEPEAWVRESTCHRSRLTVNDTLEKENKIRKTCEEVEEEVVEEEEAEEEELEEGEDMAELDDDEDDADVQAELDEEDESDEGFHSDDEDGFANSDSENDDDSDYEWWKPGGGSTAATSVEHLDRLAIVNSHQLVPGSSVGSASSGHVPPHSSRRKNVKRHQTPAMPINRLQQEPDLPDSTDFVCGTLDEDRPMEQAYINRMKMKEAAKHKTRPQDIDPSFPTSDPEMDEEDDDDVDEAEDSEEDDLMHGDLEELDGDNSAKPKLSPLTRAMSNSRRSPPPPTTRLHSTPPLKRRSVLRSPPPPARRGTARSPPPGKLFGQSPKRMRSPAPDKRMTSPPNSPTDRGVAQLATATHGFAGRPQLTHTASLPRGGGFPLSKLAAIRDEGSGSDTAVTPEVPKRGAIDIVKGLKKKRQIRQQKLYQKACQKAATKGEKPYKVKPGKGAERMREVGLQLQEYHGKAEHILSL